MTHEQGAGTAICRIAYHGMPRQPVKAGVDAEGVAADKHLVDKSNKSKEFLDVFRSVWPDAEKTATVPTIVGVYLANP